MLARNLEALHETVLPKYTEAIRNAEQDDWIEFIKSRDGMDNLLITEGSRKLPAFDLDDTMAPFEVQAKALPTREQDVSILVGTGLGYLLNEIKEVRDEKHKVIIIEPSLWLIKQALKRFDFSEEFRKKDFLLASDMADIPILLGAIDTGFVVEGYTISIENYTNTKANVYQPFIELTANIVNQMRCNTGTIMSAGAVIADNDIANLPYVIKHRGVNDLVDLFKGKPAVLVSTGPSLKKNIHLLKEYQDKVVIVAVAQALRVLYGYDITPDFITTVDFGEVNMVHLRGLMQSDVPLICLNKTYAPLLHSYQGPRFITASPNPGYEDKAHGILSGKGALDAGGSVAHLSFSAARLLGCDPLIIIGQDLALSDGESHFAQADATGDVEVDEAGMIRWKVRDQRCHLSEIDDGKFSMGFEHYVEGYFGEPVLTNIGLASFITAFEGMFRATTDRTIINSTQGGARIKGATQMSLSQALKQYANEQIDKTVLDPLLTPAPDGDELIEKVVPLLEEDLRILKQISYHTKSGIRTNKKMLKTKGWGTTMKKILGSNEHHSNEAHRLSKVLPTIALAIFGASRRIEYSDLKVQADRDHLKKDREDFKIRVRRNRMILEAAQTAARELKKTYAKTLRALKEYQETGNEQLLRPPMKDEVPSLVDAKAYFQQGNWARPLLTAREILTNLADPRKEETEEEKEAAGIILNALSMSAKAIAKAQELPDEDDIIKCNELVHEAQKLGREEQEYETSLKMLEDARELCPDNEAALWGLATTYHHTGQLEKSIEAYKDLVEVKPEEPRYLFELGQVHIKQGEIDEGLKAIAGAMEQTEEFDSFLWVVGDICAGIARRPESEDPGKTSMYQKALLSYETYLGKFPADHSVWLKHADVLSEIGSEISAEESRQEAEKLMKS